MLIENKVLGFDVSVEYLFAVDVVQGSEDAGNEKFCLLLSKTMDVCESAAKIGSRKQVHDQIEVVSVVESAAHVGDERGGESFQYFALIEYVIYAFFHDDKCLAHLLHGVELLGLVEFDLPHLPIPPFSDDLDEVKVVAGQFSLLLLSGVLGDLGEGVIQTGLLLRVVDLYHIRQ